MDVCYKNQFVAYFSKAGTVTQNPLIAVKGKVMQLTNDTAQNIVVKVGICRDCPHTDANEKLPNGPYKLAGYNSVTLACKEHHLFGYVFSACRTAPDSEEMLTRQVFYNKEFASQDFAECSGLVDEKALLSGEELWTLHAGLIKMSILDHGVSDDARGSAGRILDKIEEIMPELQEVDMDFDFDMKFGLNDEMETGGQPMMSSRRNQTIVIIRSPMYKHDLNQQLEGMTDEEYLVGPIGLDVGSYVEDSMRYCPENVVDQVMEHQDALSRWLGRDYLSMIASMPYGEDGDVKYA